MIQFKNGGTEYISGLIEAAVKDGSRTATIRGNYEIESVIRIPSDFTLILDGCHLCMADGVYSNMFTNQSRETEDAKKAAGADRNIVILGKNSPILDGGNYNGLSEKTQLTGDYPEIWHNNLILFANVDGFEMSGFACHNQRWWAINLYGCRNGKLHDLEFCSSDLMVDEEGNLSHGLIRNSYKNVLVKNADGIDLRRGCHHIDIYNITGFTEDDTIALTNLNGRGERHFGVEDLPEDICHVTIRNVKAAAYCSIVRLLNQGGTKLHDILIDGVEDTSAECPHLDVGRYGVRIGDSKHMYGSRHSTKEETYNITVRNVRSRADAALILGGSVENLVTENIEGYDGAVSILDERII